MPYKQRIHSVSIDPIKTESINPQKDPYKNIHSSFITKSPKLKSIQHSSQEIKVWNIPQQWKGKNHRMKLKNIMLNKKSQTQKSTYCITLFKWILQQARLNYGDRSQINGWHRGNGTDYEKANVIYQNSWMKLKQCL